MHVTKKRGKDEFDKRNGTHPHQYVCCAASSFTVTNSKNQLGEIPTLSWPMTSSDSGPRCLHTTLNSSVCVAGSGGRHFKANLQLHMLAQLAILHALHTFLFHMPRTPCCHEPCCYKPFFCVAACSSLANTRRAKHPLLACSSHHLDTDNNAELRLTVGHVA